jgi:hypothetical protein
VGGVGRSVSTASVAGVGFAGLDAHALESGAGGVSSWSLNPQGVGAGAFQLPSSKVCKIVLRVHQIATAIVVP